VNAAYDELLPLEEPTTVRYRVLAYLAGMTFILYLDRVCIAQAAPAIMDELELSKTEWGIVGGAFTLAYGLFEVVTGRLGDRYGARGVLTRIVIWWSIFTALTGAAIALWMLLAVRFLFGAGEAGALPNAVRVLRQWFPEATRGMAQGLVTMAMVAGGAIAPVAAAYLMKLIGWRWCFVVFGAIGVLWAMAFWSWYRDEPAEHPEVNAAERRLIVAGRASQDPAVEHPPIPWHLVLRNANLWLLGSLMTCASAVFYMLITWYPTYLEKGRQAGKLESGWLTSLVLASGAVGCVLGGQLTDLIRRRSSCVSRGHCIFGTVVCALSALFLLASLQVDSRVLSACLVGAGLLGMNLQIPVWWATVTQLSGRHVGALFGLMNSMGVVGAAASQIFLGALVDWLGELDYVGRDQWDPGIYVYPVVMLLAGGIWLFVRPGRSIVEPVPASRNG
jgi:MFS family permease